MSAEVLRLQLDLTHLARTHTVHRKTLWFMTESIHCPSLEICSQSSFPTKRHFQPVPKMFCRVSVQDRSVEYDNRQCCSMQTQHLALIIFWSCTKFLVGCIGILTAETSKMLLFENTLIPNVEIRAFSIDVAQADEKSSCMATEYKMGDLVCSLPPPLRVPHAVVIGKRCIWSASKKDVASVRNIRINQKRTKLPPLMDLRLFLCLFQVKQKRKMNSFCVTLLVVISSTLLIIEKTDASKYGKLSGNCLVSFTPPPNAGNIFFDVSQICTQFHLCVSMSMCLHFHCSVKHSHLLCGPRTHSACLPLSKFILEAVLTCTQSTCILKLMSAQLRICGQDQKSSGFLLFFFFWKGGGGRAEFYKDDMKISSHTCVGTWRKTHLNKSASPDPCTQPCMRLAHAHISIARLLQTSPNLPKRYVQAPQTVPQKNINTVLDFN